LVTITTKLDLTVDEINENKTMDDSKFFKLFFLKQISKEKINIQNDTVEFYEFVEISYSSLNKIEEMTCLFIFFSSCLLIFQHKKGFGVKKKSEEEIEKYTSKLESFRSKN
jgi:hypothetical protein